jgi:tRNA(His) guanylyltransferase
MEDSLGDLLKSLEKEATCYHAENLPLYVRLDGKSFSKVTKQLARPFSPSFIEMMKQTTLSLMKEFSVDLAFHQSDEISLLLLPRSTEGFEYPFNGKQCKIQSVFASHATWAFNKEAAISTLPIPDMPICFDARSVSLSYDEAALMMMWRHKDATRNAILQYAHGNGMKNRLNGLKTIEVLELIRNELKVNWEGVSPAFRLGTFITSDRNDDDRRTFNVHYLDKSYHFVYDFITSKYNMKGI